MEKIRTPSFKKILKTPVGPLTLIASEQALKCVLWGEVPCSGILRARETHGILSATEKQLGEYFAGKRTRFDIPLAPEGTDFQRRVWKELEKIPYGETITYGEQAYRIGSPSSTRAVGSANGRNPISILVPCHRVIGKSGALTGFAGGLDIKRRLLLLEGAIIS